MAVDITDLDAHEQPSDELRAHWKGYSKTDHKILLDHPDIDDPRVMWKNETGWSRGLQMGELGYGARKRRHDQGSSKQLHVPCEALDESQVFFLLFLTCT